VKPQSRIYLSPPDVGESERAALLDAFDGGWIAPVGPQLDQFEADLASYLGAEACTAVSSGTAALRLGLELIGVGPGDEVVVATATFAASAFAVAHAGARPVFCDVDRATWGLDPNLLEDFLAARAAAKNLPKAVMPVSLYGSAPNYPALVEVCERFEVPILEDAAEALGSRSHQGMVGALGHPSVLSFNGNKIITTSSGGAFLGTPEQCSRVRYLATQARQPALHYEHEDIGFNFRLSNLLAALGCAQLARIEDIVSRLGQINASYRTAFSEFEWCPYENTPRPNHWLSVALLPAGIDANQIAVTLNENDIEVRPAWKPMHQQPVFDACELVGSGQVAADIFARGLCLPSGSTMTDSDIDTVIAAVRSKL